MHRSAYDTLDALTRPLPSEACGLPRQGVETIKAPIEAEGGVTVLNKKVAEAVVDAQRRVLEFLRFAARESVVTSFWVPSVLDTLKHHPKRPKRPEHYQNALKA